jgi:hypothetical protein
MKFTSKTISCAMLSGALFLFVAGCAHQEGSSSANFSEVPAYKHTTSDLQSAEQATTITAPLGAGATVTRKSDSTGPQGDVIAQIQKTVLSDQTLAPYPSRITSTMDPDSNGRVILTGSVPTKAVKANVVKRVREIAGVKQVDDRLVVEYPHSSREVDIHNPTKPP